MKSCSTAKLDTLNIRTAQSRQYLSRQIASRTPSASMISIIIIIITVVVTYETTCCHAYVAYAVRWNHGKLVHSYDTNYMSSYRKAGVTVMSPATPLTLQQSSRVDQLVLVLVLVTTANRGNKLVHWRVKLEHIAYGR